MMTRAAYSMRWVMASFMLLGVSFFAFAADDVKSDLPQPPRVTPGTASTQTQVGTAPSDAIVLFDGTNLDAWEEPKWVVKDGYMEVKPKSGFMKTKEKFGDCQLHIEWRVPESEGKDTGQDCGNSGVFFMGKYEVQVLESTVNVTYADGMAASIYMQSVPSVNAGSGIGKWNSYDIIFHRPHFDEAGNVTKPATLTVLHNGVLVQNHFELEGLTLHKQKPYYKAHPDALPLTLQDHSDLVQYRNIWIRKLEK